MRKSWPEISYRQRHGAWAHVIFFGVDKIDEKWQTLMIKGQMNQNFDLFYFSSVLVKCV